MKKAFIAIMAVLFITIPVFATSPVTIKEGRIFDRFFLSDLDTKVSTAEYFGYLTSDGDWYIMKMGGSIEVSARYAGGSSGYLTAWGSRESLTYKYFNGQ